MFWCDVGDVDVCSLIALACSVTFATCPPHSNLALAQMAFEDAYLTIQDVDGVEWAEKLRRRMDTSVEEAVVTVSETTWLKE